MENITLETTVSDIVSKVPRTSDLFRELRIDFCCGGQIPLSEAIKSKNLNEEEILAAIKKIEEKYDQNTSIQTHSLTPEELISHIVDNHHKYLQEELPKLTKYVTKVARVHGDRHPHLIRLKEIFDLLKAELLEHTSDEEMTVFPLIIEYVNDPPEEHRQKLLPHLTQLETEHESTGNLLKELRDITQDFDPPIDACRTYRLVYQRLSLLEEDTFTHIHLENNILFANMKKHILQ